MKNIFLKSAVLLLIMIVGLKPQVGFAQKEPIKKDTVDLFSLTPAQRATLEKQRKENAKKEAAEAERKLKEAEKTAKKAKKDAEEAIAREKKAKEAAKAAEKREKEKAKERQKQDAKKAQTPANTKGKTTANTRDAYWKTRSSDSLAVVQKQEKDRQAKLKADKAAFEKKTTEASKSKVVVTVRHDPKYWKKRTDDSLATVKAAADKAKKAADKAKKAAEKAEKKRLAELKKAQDKAANTPKNSPSDKGKSNKTPAVSPKGPPVKHDLKYWKQHAADSANQVKKQAELDKRNKEKEQRRLAAEIKRKADADKKAAADAKNPKKNKVAKGKQDTSSGLVIFTPDGLPIVPSKPVVVETPKTNTPPVNNVKNLSPDVWQDPYPNRWKNKTNTPPTSNSNNCDWEYVEIDEFTRIERKGLKEQLFFGFTDEKYKASFPTGDYVMCYSHFSIEGKQKFLNLTYIIDSPSGRNEFGYVEKNGAIQIKLINGEIIQLASANEDKGKIYQNKTYYRLRYELNSSHIKDLSTWEIDNIRMSWSSGYEDYEVFDVDCLRRQITCIK